MKLKKFYCKHSLSKICVDCVVVLLSCLIVFCFLPRKSTFFDLASTHTTFTQKMIHALVAMVLVIVCRSVLMVYRQPWNRSRSIDYLHIIVADIMAGILFYLTTDLVMHSAYPFLLEFSLFAVLDIGTLFCRLLYSGFCDEFEFTEQ